LPRMNADKRGYRLGLSVFIRVDPRLKIVFSTFSASC